MSDKNDEKEDAIPAFRFVEKRVDDHWKEEARREREAAAKAAGGGRPQQPPPPPAQQKQQPPENSTEPAAEAKPEKPKMTPQEQHQAKIFMTFIGGLAQQALMQLGAMENPYTGQSEIDLNGARYTIDLLSTIQVKTKGNLIEEEAQALNETIHELRMNYLQIAQAVQAQQQQAAAGAMRPGPGGAIGKR